MGQTSYNKSTSAARSFTFLLDYILRDIFSSHQELSSSFDLRTKQKSLYHMKNYFRLSICKHKYTSNECVEQELQNWFQFHRWHHICFLINVDDQSDVETVVNAKLYINAVLSTTGNLPQI